MQTKNSKRKRKGVTRVGSGTLVRLRTRDTLIETLRDHAKDLERKLDAAESMLARVGRECDIVCIPTTDGDIPALRITYCEGHRVKLLRLKYEDIRNAA